MDHDYRERILELKNRLNKWIIILEGLRERLYTLMELRTVEDLREVSKQLKELKTLIKGIVPEASIYIDRVIRNINEIIE